jgi:hypothetical protein
MNIDKPKPDDSDINDLLESLAGDTTQIVSGPGAIEELERRGIVFDKQHPRTNEQFIDELFTVRREKALAVIKEFPSPPQLAIPTINSLYDEIRECILFGLNGAAITLSAILVEFALKHAIVNHTKGSNIYDKDEWDRLEGKELGPVIKEAIELKIIGEEERKNLDRFRKETRNLYLHYNIKKITSGVVMKKAKRIDIAAATVEEQDLTTEDNPIIWQAAKKFVDKESVLDVFTFADSVVRYLFCKK